MSKEKKVLMEKYKGFEIYYDKEKERFVADKDRLDIHFEARTLWEIKGHIKESQTEEVDKQAFIKSGYFDQSIAKIHLMTINKATKRCTYRILDDTDDKYDVGRTKDYQDLPKMYEIDEHNSQLYSEVKNLQNQIHELEQQQKKLVRQLK